MKKTSSNVQLLPSTSAAEVKIDIASPPGAAPAVQLSPVEEQALLALFESIDANGDGVIDEYEMVLLLQRVLSYNPTPEEVQQWMQLVSPGNQGRLSFSHFKDMSSELKSALTAPDPNQRNAAFNQAVSESVLEELTLAQGMSANDVFRKEDLKEMSNKRLPVPQYLLKNIIKLLREKKGNKADWNYGDVLAAIRLMSSIPAVQKSVGNLAASVLLPKRVAKGSPKKEVPGGPAAQTGDLTAPAGDDGAKRPSGSAAPAAADEDTSPLDAAVNEIEAAFSNVLEERLGDLWRQTDTTIAEIEEHVGASIAYAMDQVMLLTRICLVFVVIPIVIAAFYISVDFPFSSSTKIYTFIVAWIFLGFMVLLISHLANKYWFALPPAPREHSPSQASDGKPVSTVTSAGGHADEQSPSSLTPEDERNPLRAAYTYEDYPARYDSRRRLGSMPRRAYGGYANQPPTFRRYPSSRPVVPTLYMRARYDSNPHTAARQQQRTEQMLLSSSAPGGSPLQA